MLTLRLCLAAILFSDWIHHTLSHQKPAANLAFVSCCWQSSRVSVCLLSKPFWQHSAPLTSSVMCVSVSVMCVYYIVAETGFTLKQVGLVVYCFPGHSMVISHASSILFRWPLYLPVGLHVWKVQSWLLGSLFDVVNWDVEAGGSRSILTSNF